MSTRPPAKYIKPDLDAATLSRQLAGIQEQAGRARWRVPRLAYFAGVVAMVAVLVWFVRRPVASTPSSTRIAQVETASSGQSMTLAEGSRLELGGHTRLELEAVGTDKILLTLTRGEVTADVTSNPNRPFVIRAGDYEVRVIGTRFTVTRDPESGAVQVRVTRGKVSVRGAGVDREVSAGDSFDSQSLRPTEASAPAATTSAGPVPSASSAASPSAPQKPRAPSAKELFDRAQRARAAGKNAKAAAAFRELRGRYPDDPRSPLAAFELGRLELDSAKDPTAASKTLDDALGAAPKDAPYREEIEARRVEALGASGNRAKCRIARDAYLAKYPGGIHRARVSRACR